MLRRDFAYCYILKRKIESSGYNVLLLNRRNFWQFLRFIKPEILILCSSLWSHSGDSSLLGKLKGVRIYLSDAEGCIDPEVLNGESVNVGIVPFCDKVYTWNNSVKSYLINKYPSMTKKIESCGSPRISILKLIERRTIAKNTVGLIGRFCATNDFMGRPVLYSALKRWNNPFSGLVKAEYDILDIYKRLIDFLIGNNFQISWRPHPNEKIESYSPLISKYPNLITISDGTADLIEWIDSVDVVVTPLSTSMIESYLLGKPIISIDKIVKEKDKYYEDYLDNFQSLTFAPATMDELFSLFKGDALRTKPSNNAKKALQDYYNINIEDSDEKSGGFNAAFILVGDIIKNKSRRSIIGTILYPFVYLLYLFIDFVSIVRSLRGINIERHYNYSLFFHKPTPFMQRVAKRFIDEAV